MILFFYFIFLIITLFFSENDVFWKNIISTNYIFFHIIFSENMHVLYSSFLNILQYQYYT
jgi:hypothetical protein